MDSPPRGTALQPAANPTGLAAWIAAWRGLPENPVASHLLLAERRRHNRARRRRLASYILMTAIFGGLWLLVLVGEVLTTGGWKDIDAQFVCITGLGLISVLYCLWLGVGVFNAVRDALLVLAPPSKLTSGLALDDTLACTSIGDEDIVLGVLRILLPPLWWRGILGSALFWAWTLVAITEGLEGWGREAEKLLVMLPVAVSLMALSSALGAVVLLLFYLAISRMQSPLGLSAGAVVATLAQLVWIAIGSGLAFAEAFALGDFTGMGQFRLLGIWLAGTFLFFCLVGVAGLRGRYSPLVRSASTILGPWLVPLLLIMGFLVWQIFSEFNGFGLHDEEFGVLILSYLQTWGAVLPFNSAAAHGPLLLGLIGDEPPMLVQTLRIPAAYLFQISLIAALAWAARDSVKRRRTEGIVSKG